MGNASTCSIIIGRHDMTHAYVYLSTLHGDLRFISSVFIKHQIMSIQTNGTMLMSSIKLKINNTGIPMMSFGSKLYNWLNGFFCYHNIKFKGDGYWYMYQLLISRQYQEKCEYTWSCKNLKAGRILDNNILHNFYSGGGGIHCIFSTNFKNFPPWLRRTNYYNCKFVF